MNELLKSVPPTDWPALEGARAEAERLFAQRNDVFERLERLRLIDRTNAADDDLHAAAAANAPSNARAQEGGSPDPGRCRVPIERREGCSGRPRKFCADCVPSGSLAERAEAWRRINQDRIEAYRREVWERERAEAAERAEALRLADRAALRAQNERFEAWRRDKEASCR